MSCLKIPLDAKYGKTNVNQESCHMSKDVRWWNTQTLHTNGLTKSCLIQYQLPLLDQTSGGKSAPHP